MRALSRTLFVYSSRVGKLVEHILAAAVSHFCHLDLKNLIYTKEIKIELDLDGLVTIRLLWT